MASIEPGVLPSMALAALPTAMPSSRTSFVPFLTATTLGSLRMIPRPRTQTRVFAVPRSIPMSTEKLPRTHSRGFRNEAMDGEEMRNRGRNGVAAERPGLSPRELPRTAGGRLCSRGPQCSYAGSPFKRAPRAGTGSGGNARTISSPAVRLESSALEQDAVAALAVEHVDEHERRDQHDGGQDRETG